MVLLKVRGSRHDPVETAAPETGAASDTGRGVRATWRYTVGSIVGYSVFVSVVATLIMLDGGDDELQLFDLLIVALVVTAIAALTRYCWFFRSGLGGGLPEQRYTLWLLLPAAALWVICLFQPHTLWVGGLPLWIAANALSVVVGRRFRWWVLGAGFAALVLHGPLGFLLGRNVVEAAWDAGGLVPAAVYALMTPLLFMGSIWWWEIVVRLDDSRSTSCELAVAKERLRFAADLHDIQGHHLQVIALKTELAGRLLDADPEAARTQISEVQHLARTALEDTRALVHGYRKVSLASEAANAAEVLRAAGIDCSVEVDAEGLPPEERTLFGLVIREATTNILRHSEAKAVALRLQRSRDNFVLTVTNDGVVGEEIPRPGGSGIDGLRQRFETVGGGIAAQRRGGDFVLTATVPRHGRAALPGVSVPGASVPRTAAGEARP